MVREGSSTAYNHAVSNSSTLLGWMNARHQGSPKHLHVHLPALYALSCAHPLSLLACLQGCDGLHQARVLTYPQPRTVSQHCKTVPGNNRSTDAPSLCPHQCLDLNILQSELLDVHVCLQTMHGACIGRTLCQGAAHLQPSAHLSPESVQTRQTTDLAQRSATWGNWGVLCAVR
jgi:hypothetical protein